MTKAPVVVLGFVPAILKWLADKEPQQPVVVVEDPDILRKAGAREKLAGLPTIREVIECDYQPVWMADEFYNSHRQLRPIAVAPVWEYSTPFAARLSERYGVPGAGFGAAVMLRDKEHLRRVSRAAGIRNPPFEPAQSAEDVRKFMIIHPGPAVLKPANRQAAVGVRIIGSADEADDAWAECLLQDEGARVSDRPVPLRMLVESHVAGDEYSVEMLICEGRPLFTNVTAKTLFPGPRPVELGHAIPADLPDELSEVLAGQTRRLIKAVGFQTGIVHCEWIAAPDGVYLVECAGRFPGDHILDLIEHAYGYDLLAAFWAMMRGMVPEPRPKRAMRGAAVHFLRSEPGEIMAVHGLEAARAAPGVTAATVTAQPGEVARPLLSSWDRVGSVLACAPTAGEAARLAKDASGLIQIAVR